MDTKDEWKVFLGTVLRNQLEEVEHLATIAQGEIKENNSGIAYNTLSLIKSNSTKQLLRLNELLGLDD